MSRQMAENIPMEKASACGKPRLGWRVLGIQKMDMAKQ
jgi:hypothetical protein